MGKLLIIRILAGASIFIVALSGPWWLFLLLMIIFAFAFPWFLEGVAAAVLHDALYGLTLSRFGGIDILMTIVSVCFLGIGFFVRTRVRIERGTRL
jgi:hypothetical protein